MGFVWNLFQRVKGVMTYVDFRLTKSGYRPKSNRYDIDNIYENCRCFRQIYSLIKVVKLSQYDYIAWFLSKNPAFNQNGKFKIQKHNE